MRAALLALLALALPLRATDVGTHVEFPGMEERIAASAGVKSGEVMWESGPSEAVGAAFEAILFQGRLGGPGARVEASVDGGPWTEAAGERSRDGRFWSKVRASGKKGSVVRLRALSGGPGAWIEIFGVYASDQEEERPASGVYRPSAAAFVPTALAYASPKPPVEPRSAWGALPAAKPYEPTTPERISVHHTEAPQPSSRDAAADEMQGIQRFHQRGRGWIDIAYHFLIDGSGRIWEGRPLGLVGAHVKDRNDGNVGIALMGDFSPRRQKPTAAQLDALIRLTRWLSETYTIPAERIKGHRDQEITSCPGKALYARLDEVRRAASATNGLYASTRRAGVVMEEPAW
ncbi:MAG: peptidoglycan recognition protein [Elusimicrobia bacterium]|nr:peptidoglycan recognition protein [Elusimicrobiota bacterium]